MSDTIIKVTEVTKKYHKNTILDNVNFEIKAGDYVGIIGHNGSGKSTLLKILSGAIKPNGGSLTIYNEDAFKNKNLFSKHIGYIPQENPLFENLTVLDNLKLWYCESDRKLSEDLENGRLHDFGLDKYRNYTVSKLSGGMKKRLSIACAIAKDPKLLILDEPGASLDIVCKADICRYLREYNKAGGTVIITSHEEGELASCNRMLLIKNSILSEVTPVYTSDQLMKLIKAD